MLHQEIHGSSLLLPYSFFPHLQVTLSSHGCCLTTSRNQISSKTGFIFGSITGLQNQLLIYDNEIFDEQGFRILGDSKVDLAPTPNADIGDPRVSQQLEWTEATAFIFPNNVNRTTEGPQLLIVANLSYVRGSLCGGCVLAFWVYVYDKSVHGLVDYKTKVGYAYHLTISMEKHVKLSISKRIPLSPSDDDMFPFKLRRKQFPVRLCFAMTINKAQGQTIPNVGVYLPEPVFSHGQLYVALSRGISRGNTKVLVKSVEKSNVDEVYTSNVVYKEVTSLPVELQGVDRGSRVISGLKCSYQVGLKGESRNLASSTGVSSVALVLNHMKIGSRNLILSILEVANVTSLISILNWSYKANMERTTSSAPKLVPLSLKPSNLYFSSHASRLVSEVYLATQGRKHSLFISEDGCADLFSRCYLILQAPLLYGCVVCE
ncbi:hypothetical protein LXL04_038397 [Taraxacum kok-saghyz]